MTALDFLKQVSPKDEIRIRNELMKSGLLKHILRIMDMYFDFKIKKIASKIKAETKKNGSFSADSDKMNKILEL